MRAEVHVKTLGAKKKLLKLEKAYTQQGNRSVEMIGRMGKQFARSIAPFWSGKTFRNIVLKRGVKGQDFEVMIMAQNPTRGKVSPSLGPFNLVRWMHTSRNAISHIKSGNPRFMFMTRSYLRRVGVERVRAGFRRIKI